MSDRCESCEQVAAELRAQLRAECNQLREGLLRRLDGIFDRVAASAADVEAKNLGLIADIERRMLRLFDRVSEHLGLPLDEEPPRPH
jgi:hypothetical protein